MTGSLSQDQVSQFKRDGILFPIPALSPAESAVALRNFEVLEAREGGKVSPGTNGKPHILLPWLDDMIRHPRVLDAVESILGPNLLCWVSSFFAKSPGDNAFVSWHQDSTYWGLSSLDVVTAWVALTPSTTENGCLQVLPGSHLHDQMPHHDTFSKDNMLSRGQEIAVEVDEAQALNVVLRPGEMSLHHVRIAHGSKANTGGGRRIGFAIRYIPTYVSQIGGRTTAALVRGVDEFHHFDPEPRPHAEFEPEAIAFHDQSLKRLFNVNNAG